MQEQQQQTHTHTLSLSASLLTSLLTSLCGVSHLKNIFVLALKLVCVCLGAVQLALPSVGVLAKQRHEHICATHMNTRTTTNDNRAGDGEMV